jgi:hypothetical protein
MPLKEKTEEEDHDDVKDPLKDDVKDPLKDVKDDNNRHRHKRNATWLNMPRPYFIDISRNISDKADFW